MKHEICKTMIFQILRVKRIGKLSPNAYTKNVRIIYEGSKNQFSQIDSNNLLVSDLKVNKFNLIFENK